MRSPQPSLDSYKKTTIMVKWFKLIKYIIYIRKALIIKTCFIGKIRKYIVDLKYFEFWYSASDLKYLL